MNEPSKLHVLFATYPWAFETPGGGEIQLEKYAKYLPSHHIETSRHDPWRPNLNGVSLVHFFSCVGGSVHFCAYVKSRGLPLVISSSLWITEETKHLYPSDEISAQLSLADVIVTNSKAESKQLSRILSLPADRFMEIFNGFEPSFPRADPRIIRDRFDLRGPFVLNVANIEPRKNQLGLVRALKNFDVPLVMVGALRDRTYADQVFAEAGPLVSYLGTIEHEDDALASAFCACSAFALPSTLETPGLAALEAAACGTPVVVTSEGCAYEYFGDHARYVRPDDYSGIRSAIGSVLAAKPSIELQQQVVSRFAWPKVTAELLSVYRKAISRHEAR